MGYLADEAGPGAVAMMRSIKQALDPKNIMNPGKIFSA
jgi:D-lactate dehydrogenase (cytochrome)